METLVIKTKATVSGSGFTKLNNYVGIEFTRGASNGGGDKGYHKMIGNESLIESLELFSNIKPCIVKDGEITKELNPTNWHKDILGNNVNLATVDGDVMICYPRMYAILGGSNATYERWIYSDAPFSYDGDDAELIEPFGECPDYEIVIDGKSRSIMNAVSTNNTGATLGQMGATNATNITDNYYAAPNGFPTISISRGGYESYAHAKNVNPSSNFPYCNGNVIDMRVILGILYIECRTKAVNSVFGHGISSNVGITGDNWGTVSGFKTTGDNGNTVYINFGDNTIINNATPANNSLWRALCGGQYSLLKVMDAQDAISSGTAIETVKNSEGVNLKGMTDGVMSGIFTKRITFNLVCGLAATIDSGNSTTVKNRSFELVLRVPVWRGRTNLYGNIFSHLSGADIVRRLENEEIVQDLYTAKSIAGITSSTAERTNESNYEQLFGISGYNKYTNIGNTSGWMKDSLYKDGKTEIVGMYNVGAAINSYECAYVGYSLDNNYIPDVAPGWGGAAGHFVRMQAGRLGGYASVGTCVPRFVFAYNAPSSTNSYAGSRFRVAISNN